MLKEQYGIPHLSSGDILRAQVAAGTEFGKKIKQYMDRGEIGPAELITEVVLAPHRRALPRRIHPRRVPPDRVPGGKARGSGTPSTRRYSSMSRAKRSPPRITGRRTCRKCNASIHVKNSPPKTDGVCDRCGGQLYQRPDDNEETVVNRIQGLHRGNACPCWIFTGRRGCSARSTARADGETVFRDIISILSRAPHPAPRALA